MAFFVSPEILEAWKESGGRCQCTRTSHGHDGRCNRLLSFYDKGIDGALGWQPYYVDSKVNGKPNDQSKIEIICMDCFKKNNSLGE